MLQSVVRRWPWFIILGLIGGAHAAAQTAPAANSRYELRDGEAYDKKTDLTWDRCSIGQRWKQGLGCVGVIRQLTFDDAQKLAKGGTWRVPSKDELLTLLDHDRVKDRRIPTVDVTAFPDMDLSKLAYWTSTSGGDTSALYIRFDGSTIHADSGSRKSAGAVRLVRDGQ